MTIYSLYIYDRHCTCVYYHDWQRTKQARPATEGGILPAVSQSVSPHKHDSVTPYNPRNTLSSLSGVVIAVNEDHPNPQSNSRGPTPNPPSQSQQQPQSGLPFDEEAKLVYGVVISLRNMIRKLSGKDEQFVNYYTSTYKLHLYETMSGYKFVMLSDPNVDSLRFVLRQMYSGPFLEYVVRNPLVPMDSKQRGIDNEYFRTSVDRMVRGLSVFL
ncbi:Trafficking protein particle complex subunit [Abortiporus biennis]